ncbi:MAG: phytanoyl-CoA dioxygenase family protein [Verrucomicrobiota bacterium]
MPHSLETNGFAILPKIIGLTQRQRLIETLGPVSGAGRRGLLGIPEVSEIARSERVLDLIRPHLPISPTPVRSIYFDKSAEANWLVSWHQDLTIALQNPSDIDGFGPWSTKDGIPHVQPPVEMLQRMLTIRIHLDDANESNGALRVLPGTHRLGRLSPDQIQEQRSQVPESLCSVSAGDALLMRPLLLHASGRSTSPNHRRILHIEYAGFTLPSGTLWHEQA